jgi:ubiquinone/menaquinone biosynthesis C-methylase UbiE
MKALVRSAFEALRSAVPRRRVTADNYKSWWERSASTQEGAYTTTYVTNNETDYRSRGWNGDANSFGARHFIDFAGLTTASRVLEIGCGMARVGRELAPHVGEWHGVDISRNMLERAKARTSHLANVFLHELLDVGLSQFADESFDFVYATTVFMHLDKEDLYQYLLESHRVLKPSGMAFFDTWNLLHPDTYRLWKGIQRGNLGGRKIRGRIQFTTPQELERYLDEVGFQIVRFDRERLLRALCKKAAPAAFDPDDGLPPFGCVDLPRNESRVTGIMTVAGWALDQVEAVEIRLDGVLELGRAQLGDESPDVAQLFPRYREAPSCRWHVDVSLDGPEPGHHTLQVAACDRQGHQVDLAGNYLGFTVEK